MSSNTSASKGDAYPLKYSNPRGFGYGSYLSNDLNKVHAPVDQSTTTQRVLSHHQVWGVVVSAVVSSLPAFLVGVTLGFSSSALLDLDDLETRQEYKFNLVLSDMFGVG